MVSDAGVCPAERGNEVKHIGVILKSICGKLFKNSAPVESEMEKALEDWKVKQEAWNNAILKTVADGTEKTR